jgi:hypothetical protein
MAQQQQQQSVPIVKTVAAIKYQGDMAALLEKIAEIYGETIGLDVDPRHPQSLVNIDLREAGLRDVLNAIVQSEPKYQWRESDGFIEVFPKQGSSPLLDTKINSFIVRDVDQTEAISRLMSLSEVLVHMSEMNLSRRDFSPASLRPKGEKFSLSLEGVTMRRALHEIAGAGGGRFWIARRSGNKADGGFFSISDRVR